MYPFDTLKTQIQSYCVDCPIEAAAKTTEASTQAIRTAATESAASPAASGMLGALRYHFNATTSSTAAFGRLWRGAQVMALGCIPAHALYFSSYEMIKSFFLNHQDDASSNNLGALGSTVAGMTAALCHDTGTFLQRKVLTSLLNEYNSPTILLIVMVPADTVKQRMQLGYYEGMSDAFRTMVRQEGAAGLYRALPVTLLTNLPYGAHASSFLTLTCCPYYYVCSPIVFYLPRCHHGDNQRTLTRIANEANTCDNAGCEDDSTCGLWCRNGGGGCNHAARSVKDEAPDTGTGCGAMRCNWIVLSKD